MIIGWLEVCNEFQINHDVSDCCSHAALMLLGVSASALIQSKNLEKCNAFFNNKISGIGLLCFFLRLFFFAY